MRHIPNHKLNFIFHFVPIPNERISFSVMTLAMFCGGESVLQEGIWHSLICIAFDFARVMFIFSRVCSSFVRLTLSLNLPFYLPLSPYPFLSHIIFHHCVVNSLPPPCSSSTLSCLWLCDRKAKDIPCLAGHLQGHLLNSHNLYLLPPTL